MSAYYRKYSGYSEAWYLNSRLGPSFASAKTPLVLLLISLVRLNRHRALSGIWNVAD